MFQVSEYETKEEPYPRPSCVSECDGATSEEQETGQYSMRLSEELVAQEIEQEIANIPPSYLVR